MRAVVLGVLLPALAAAQDGGHFGGVPDPEPPGDATLVVRDGQPVAVPPQPAPSLPDLALNCDAIVRARGLERRGEWLRLPVGGWLWGRGPDELFVRDTAFAPGEPEAGAADEWIVFLGQGAGGMSALAARVAPVEALEPLLAVRRGEVALEAWFAERLRPPLSADGVLLALHAAALPAARDGAARALPGVTRLAALRFGALAQDIERAETARQPPRTSSAWQALVASPDGPWAPVIERLAPQAPPAVVLERLAPDPADRPYDTLLALERRYTQAVVAAAGARPALDGRPVDAPVQPLTRATLRDWLRQHRAALLRQDLDFVQAALDEGGPANVEAAASCVAAHTGWNVQLADGASYDARQALARAFGEWCAEQKGP